MSEDAFHYFVSPEGVAKSFSQFLFCPNSYSVGLPELETVICVYEQYNT